MTSGRRERERESERAGEGLETNTADFLARTKGSLCTETPPHTERTKAKTRPTWQSEGMLASSVFQLYISSKLLVEEFGNRPGQL